MLVELLINPILRRTVVNETRRCHHVLTVQIDTIEQCDSTLP